MTVHRDRLLMNEANRCTIIYQLFISGNNSINYTSAVVRLISSWWWAEKLPETCRAVFATNKQLENYSASVGFIHTICHDARSYNPKVLRSRLWGFVIREVNKRKSSWEVVSLRLCVRVFRVQNSWIDFTYIWHVMEGRNYNFGSLRLINELGAAWIFLKKRGVEPTCTESKYIRIGLYTNIPEHIRSLFCHTFDNYGSSNSVTLKNDVMSASGK